MLSLTRFLSVVCVTVLSLHTVRGDVPKKPSTTAAPAKAPIAKTVTATKPEPAKSVEPAPATAAAPVVVEPAKIEPAATEPKKDEPVVKASPSETVEADPIGAATTLVTAIKGGQWRIVASLVLAFLMLALAKLRTKLKWFEGDRGGAILVGLLAMLGAFATTLAAEAKVDFQLILGTLGVMWTAVGGYSWVKRLIWPQDAKAPEKANG